MGTNDEGFENRIREIKRHTARLIEDILRDGMPELHPNESDSFRRYDYLKGMKHILSHDGKQANIVVLNKQKWLGCVLSLGDMGLLIGEAYDDYRKYRMSHPETRNTLT
jgi:hypothetical protein